MRTPAKGIAQVQSSAGPRNTGTARVGPGFRKVQHMARIATAGGKTTLSPGDELAKECIARVGAEVLDELVNRKVIELECARRGITVTNAEVKQEVVRLCKETGMEPSQWYQILKADKHHARAIPPEPDLARDGNEEAGGASVVVKEQDLKTAYDHHFGPRVKVRLVLREHPPGQRGLERPAEKSGRF
ncbi:MAG: hypothetical protein Ct9H300mP1_28790 [Planctomycetaceae bacterium]|nr:MAG: hypothetical protein Ct9H300mP1_28790 [Planctomycetaceae bacterium]